MYRDLKPENVMVFSDGYVKISDFGLAKKTVQGKNSRTILGTRFYYAP
jgi:serine/threonine protein kinase